MTIRDDLTVNWQTDPRLITVAAPSTELTIQDQVDTLRDFEDKPENEAYDYLIDAAGKEDLGGGILVGITSNMNNAQIAFAARTASVSAGTATSADATGTTLTDTAATFITDGVEVGAVIINFDDLSVATVLTVDSETQISHEPLDDGTNDDWTSGDSYKIWNYVICELSGGNAVAEDENGAQINVLQPRFGVSYVRTSSSSSTLQELGSIQFSSFNGGITVDTTSSYSGTYFPVGTPQEPVNNLADALDIANTRGFDTLYILGDITLDSGLDFSGLTIIGESMSKSTITISSAANVYRSEFYDCFVKGTLDGEAVLNHCRIEDLDYISGYVERCVLDPGTILLGGVEAHFLDCWSGATETTPPVLDLGGSGTALAIRNFNGCIKLENKSGPEGASIDLNSGHVVLDNTVTAGTITIRGIGKLTDNSAGATVNSDNLLTGDDAVAQAVWDGNAEATLTYAEFMRIMFAVLAGQSTGGGTGINAFRDYANAKDRVAMTVDATGNRTSVVTLDGS